MYIKNDKYVDADVVFGLLFWLMPFHLLERFCFARLYIYFLRGLGGGVVVVA